MGRLDWVDRKMARPLFGALRSRMLSGFLATMIVAQPFGAASRTAPILWSLKKPAGSAGVSAGWTMPPPAAAQKGGDSLPMLPDPTDGRTIGSAPPPRDFSIAPSAENILNRRHDLSEDQSGPPGNSNGYLRSVGRTFGLALKKTLY